MSAEPRDTRSWSDALRESLARILGVTDLDPERPLFDLGLGSVQAMRLAADLAARLGRPVSPTLLWEHPTLAGLAAHLAGAPAHAHARPHAPAPADDPIALVGMACRFPRSPDLAAFWRLLDDALDATASVPADRWDLASYHDPDPAAPGKSVAARGAFLDDVRGFEPLFFGISPREADELDPQQRLALELTWEALEDAGLPPRGLAGSATAVFFGAMWHDWADLTHADLAGMSSHRATGISNNLIANRVSYALGLRGPSLVLDTACSSALVAAHLAVQALRSGDAELAIVGAVNLLLAPESMVFCSKFGGLAPDGRCKAFDSRADGFGRGEGGGVVVLRRLSRALAAGDRIYALLRGSAVNNDGASQGLTAPNPRAQEDVLRLALGRAGLSGAALHVVEAHGTGTFLGDPIEAAALGAVYGEDRPPERPLLVGSVKTNIGHTEGAAGIAGLIKATLALHHRAVPASLHLQRPNPHIAFDALRLRVPTVTEPWPAAPDVPGLVGVSAFGWGGTNAHVILEGPPPEPRCFCLAADSDAELDARLLDLRARAERTAWPLLLDPEPHRGPRRLALLARGIDELRARLGAALRREPCDGLALPAPGPAPALVFVCSPLGSQWPGMARRLLASEPAFRAAVDRCDRAFAPLLGRSIRDDLVGAWTDIDDVIRVQPLLFTVQVGLAALLRSWGVTPAAVLGHSAGEIAAAHIAGALDLDQAAAVVTHYARVQRTNAGRGAMAVIALPADALAARLAARAPLSDANTSDTLGPDLTRVAIAAHNSAASTVVSGPADAVAALLAALQAEGVACSPIRTDVAGHSPLVQGGLPELAAALADLRPAAPRVPLVSSVTGGPLDRSQDGAYWACNLGQVVRFHEATLHLLASGHTHFVELGPHPVVAHAIRECAAEAGRSVQVLPTLRRADDERLSLLAARAALFAAGAAADPPPEPPELLVLTARSAPALAESAARLADWLDERPLAVRDLAHTAALRRSHLEHRLALVGRSRADLAAGLRSGAGTRGHVQARPRVVFVFPGQGSQWLGMARSLYADEPVFRARLEACDRALAPVFAGSVIAELHAAPDAARTGRSDVVQPLLWAVGLALAELWQHWGVTPDAVVGHSMGEVAAACVAGALDLEAGARLIAERSRIARTRAGGAMALVELALPDALAAVSACAGRLVVGVHNGPRECVLSGDPDALDAVLADLAARGVFTRRVKVDYASHSPHMDPLRGPLLAALGGLAPRPGRVPMLSTLRADWQPGEGLGAAYWADNLRERVRFADAIARLLADTPGTPTATWRGQPRVFLEVSPHPVLVPAIRDALRDHDDVHRALGSLRRDEDERSCLLDAAGALFAAGLDLDFARLRPGGGRVVSLPPVAWQRTPHWFTATATARPRGGHPILGLAFTTPAQPGAHFFAGRLDPAAQPYLADHRVGDAAIVPAATWLDLALAAARAARGPRSAWTIAGAAFHEALVLPETGAEIQLALTPDPDGALAFTCFGRAAETWTRHASGHLRPATPVPADTSPSSTDLSRETASLASATPVPGDTFYAALARRGLRYGPRCRGVRSLRAEPGRVLAELAAPPGSAAPGSVLPPALLDAALHALVAALPDDGRPVIPVSLHALRLHGDLATAARLVGRVRSASPRSDASPLSDADPPILDARLPGDGASSDADLQVFDAHGRLLLDIEGLGLKHLPAARLRHDDLLALTWQPLAHAPAPTRPRRWLLAAARDDLAAPLRDLLRAAGDQVLDLEGDPDLALRDAPWDGVIHLAAAPPPDFDWTHALDVADEALRLTQAILRTQARDPPRLWLVTRGATACDARPPNLAHAPLAGLGLTLAYEHPELRCTRVDLSHTPGERELQALVAELRAGDREDQLALRDDQRLGARLAPGSAARGELDLAGGAHLITGGLGDLGLALAGWLVEHGCRALALVGRSGVTRPEQAAAIDRLRAAGAQVGVHRVDVADRDALAAVLADLPRPLVGVFHLAAVLDDALVTRQDRAGLQRVMAPKLAGAWNLHLLTRDRPLRHFVLYTSAASLLGSPGQSNYAAANACLDALAEHRRALGLPALAVHWGALEGLGLAARDERRGARLAGRGMLPLPLARAHEHLALLLADPALTRIGACPLDLRQWLEFHLAAAASPLFRDLQSAPAPPRPDLDLPRELAALPLEGRTRRLEEFLRAQVLRVLRVDAARVHRRASLLDLGLDSLTGLELRNRLEAGLGLRLPAALAWSHPRLDLLADDLAARLAPPPAAPAETPAPDDDALTAMSDDDLLRTLAAELGLPE